MSSQPERASSGTEDRVSENSSLKDTTPVGSVGEDADVVDEGADPRQDPWWPDDVEHPVTELLAPTQGASSPFGDTVFPLPQGSLDYEHPVTEINR